MMLSTSFKAQGHPDILSTHRTTLMTTKDKHLTKRGDCIVAVNAEKALLDLDDDIKEVARSGETVISLKLEAGGEEFTVLATNRLDDRFDASAAVAGDALYLRGRGHLYCLAAEPAAGSGEQP